MCKVYIVTEGSYSDYHIVGVFSTLEGAQIIYDSFIDIYDRPNIEECNLDALKIYPRWDVRMDICGNTTHVSKCNNLWEEEKHRAYTIYKSFKDEAKLVLYLYNIVADNEQHAVKIANEMRILLLAKGEFIESKIQEEV